MMINGKPGEIVKGDAHTVMFQFPEPYYMLPDVLAGFDDVGRAGANGLNGMGGYAPAHYLKQYHPNVSKDDLDKRSKTPSSITGCTSSSRTTGP
jgi:hypothetical protein